MSDSWQEYEAAILSAFQEEFPNTRILANQARLGRYSKVERQIDVLIEGQIAGNRFSVIVDAKFYNKKVNVKGVEEFIGMLGDIGAHKGLMITRVGYSEAAIQRAFNDPSDIELDILNFADLKQYQGVVAVPYSGKHGACIKAPFGWIIDARQGAGPSPAHLHQRGLTLENAVARGEVMYVNFWDRLKNKESLDDLIELQKNNLLRADENTHIEYLPTVVRDDAETRLRFALVPSYVGIYEYTGFVQFDEFIFFAVLLTPTQVAAKNLRKLESVMLSALPLKMVRKGREVT